VQNDIGADRKKCTSKKSSDHSTDAPKNMTWRIRFAHLFVPFTGAAKLINKKQEPIISTH
jgi:hypothetical protein